MTPATDIIRRRSLVIANLMGLGIIAVVVAGFAGVVWLLAG